MINGSKEVFRWIGVWVYACSLLLACSNQGGSDSSAAIDSAAPAVDAARQARMPSIVFFGNSLTAGYGLEPDQAFPALIQQIIDSLQAGYTVVNAGLSGETTAGGKGRINWILRNPIDIFVLELGANDGLRGIPLAETEANLQAIVDAVRKANPSVKLVMAGMEVPPNMGAAYSSEFRNIFPRIAKRNGMALIPFLLEGVGGVPELNQADGIHPTVEGQKRVAANVWKVLAPLVPQP